MSEQISFDQIISCMEEPRDTLVLFHRAPDADAVGSAYAMKKLLEAFGSRAWCVCAGELPARLSFLLFGEQESVLPESIPQDMRVSRIVSVDTASPSQLDRLYELFGDQVDLMIDHHGKGDAYARLSYVRPDAAATGEILFDLFEELSRKEGFEMPLSVACALYAAISSDTGGFRFSNVTPSTHMRAAKLLGRGIDAAHINHLLFECKSPDQLRAEAAGISALELYADGRVAVISFPYTLKASLALEDAHLETLIDVARSVSGVLLAFCIRQPQPEGKFRVSARSSCQYDVSALCATFGGGGHTRAAGCTVVASDVAEAREKLLSAIDFSRLN
ncbi:MAG: bifunctional oligoribonuclease/PAP phosphatase NrnA [Ruminococcaceae bacterium]|nr:bifunctional oligoribonuclease/PAP phosphatase NrnA [Oscillospiraceae bacterium]